MAPWTVSGAVGASVGGGLSDGPPKSSRSPGSSKPIALATAAIARTAMMASTSARRAGRHDQPRRVGGSSAAASIRDADDRGDIGRVRPGRRARPREGRAEVAQRGFEVRVGASVHRQVSHVRAPLRPRPARRGAGPAPATSAT